MRRIERLINLIAALLDARHPMTADDIRATIHGYDQRSHDAFRRTFERDKQDLRDMGIPLEAVPTDPFSDQADGYIIPKGSYYLPRLDLDDDELAALKIAADAVLGAGEEAEAGYLKLSFDARAPHAGHPVVAGADVAPDARVTALFRAQHDRRTVAFRYRTAAGGVADRTVDPYGLVQRSGHWYVVGRDRARDDVRSFKVSRMTSDVAATADTYEIPESFEAASHLGSEPWEIGAEPPATATVRFDAEMRWWAEQNLAELPRREAPAGAVDVEFPVANVDALVSWVLGFGAAVEIVSPPEARARLLELLEPFLTRP